MLLIDKSISYGQCELLVILTNPLLEMKVPSNLIILNYLIKVCITMAIWLLLSI
jgi:hypothetical protein